MTKFLAAVHDPDSLLARRGRLKDAGPQDQRPTREEPKARSAEPALDSEMLDLVTRFEQNFAELAPAREEVHNSALTDDLFPEFPETPFDPPPARSRPRALELARIEPQARREEPRTAPRAEVRATAPVDEQVDIDEAFSILKAAENKRAELRHAVDDAPSAADRAMPPPDVLPELRQESKRGAPLASDDVQRNDWASRSHGPRSVAIAIGVGVLALGLTVGYIAGRTPKTKAHVVIEATQQGGTVLRLDPNLSNLGKR